MKGEKTVFKENIPASSVQRKSRSISVLQKNLVDRIFCTVFETACASSLAMCAYQIGEHLHLTFADHLDL
jgi:hypothetical protein